MRAVPVLILVAVLSFGAAQDAATTDGNSDILNSIETKPSARLDPYIRKALLKALSELEEGGTTGFDTTDDFTGPTEDITETSPEPTKGGIQIHSFVVNGQSAFDNNSSTPTLIDSNISILSTTVGNVENQLSSAQPTRSPYNEIFQARATGNIHQRSIQSTSKISVENNEKKTTFKPRPTTTTSTTTTTTTTTTPKPTHNEDGENIEEVDKTGVQVFSAPLVAAFTVHQDAHGLPKKVIPIYQQSNGPRPLRPLSTANPLSYTSSNSFAKSQISDSGFITEQLTLQRQLEEKQRILEEQLRILLIQQKEQEELLRKQQFLLQQKEVQMQQINFEQNQQNRVSAIEQKPPTTNPANFQIQKSVQQNPFANPSGLRQQNSQVLIQSSVPIDHNNAVTNQQLPNREAVDFLLHLRNQVSEQFPLQDNHLPQSITSFLQPASQQTFHQGVNFNQIRPAGDQLAQKQGTRVFRHESGVGNFGLNNQNFNQNFNNQNFNNQNFNNQNFNNHNFNNQNFNNQNFNQNSNRFGPIYTNRFFSANRQNQIVNADVELKQLLSQNFLNGRGQAHEDFNIVTKVLSLNHGLAPFNNNVNNRLPFDSRRQFK